MAIKWRVKGKATFPMVVKKEYVGAGDRGSLG